MSHFCGLVILTPEYAKVNGMDDSLIVSAICQIMTNRDSWSII